MSPTDEPGRQYANPPIEEALCQFTFATPIEWTVATPGLLFQELREQYPAPPEQQEELAASFELGPASAERQAGFKLNRGPTRVLFRDNDRKHLLVANAQQLSVNSLRPYEGWVSLANRLHDAGDAFERAGISPVIQRVSIRYINLIDVPGMEIPVEEYFTTPVRHVRSDAASISNFLIRVGSSLSDNESSATITFASMESSDPGIEQARFLLDLEFWRNSDSGWTFREAENIANDLKGRENAEFESLITDKTRGLFE